MIRIAKWVLLPLLVVCSGCRDIAIIDMDTGKSHYLRSGSFAYGFMMRQRVVSVDHKDGTFITLTRGESSYLLKGFNQKGKKVLEHTIPASWGQMAFAHDGSNRVVVCCYHAVYLFDFSTEQETILWDGIADSWRFPVLEWISDSQVVVVLREYENTVPKQGNGGLVVVLDIPSGKRRTIYEPTDPFEYSLSPDNSLLAIKDNYRKNDGWMIKVLNVHTGTIQATLHSECPSDLCWSPDGTEIAYLDYADARDSIKVWRLSDNTTRTLYTFPKGSYCYALVFGTGVVGYRAGPQDSAVTSLVFLDRHSGKQLRKVREEFNGCMKHLKDNTIVCEIGY